MVLTKSWINSIIRPYYNMIGQRNQRCPYCEKPICGICWNRQPRASWPWASLMRREPGRKTCTHARPVEKHHGAFRHQSGTPRLVRIRPVWEYSQDGRECRRGQSVPVFQRIRWWRTGAGLLQLPLLQSPKWQVD